MGVGLGLVSGSLALAGPAQAQATDTYLSGEGSSASCTHENPCSSLSQAITATAAGGVIHCLENFNFGYGVIRKPLTIECGRSGAGSSTSGGATIAVEIDEAEYPDAVVVLRGIAVQGRRHFGSGTPGNGVSITGGGAAVIIEDSTISGFGDQGIAFGANYSMDLVVRNTTISDNNGGVLIKPGSASALLRASFSNVSFNRNGRYGLQAQDGVLVDVSDSVASNNVIGFIAASFNRGVDIMLDDVVVSSNTRGVVGAGANGSVRVSNSLLTGNNLAMDGNVISLGGSSFTLNGTDGVFKATIAKR